MKEFNVIVQAEIKVQFDENSEEFKELWEQYLEYFDSNATYDTFCENIASLVSRYGTYEFIEGVGHVNLNGKPQKFYFEGEYKEHPGIVNIEVETDLNSMIDFEIYEIEEIQ